MVSSCKCTHLMQQSTPFTSFRTPITAISHFDLIVNLESNSGLTLVNQRCACTCNPATLEAEFRNGVGSIPVGGNSPSKGGWIV